MTGKDTTSLTSAALQDVLGKTILIRPVRSEGIPGFILHLVAQTLVLTLIDLLNQEKKTSSPKTFIFLDIDTTEKYCDPK